MKKTISKISIIASVLLLGGCSQIGQVDSQFKEKASETKIRKDDSLRKTVDEVRLKNKYVNVDYKKEIKQLLEELSTIDNRSYFLKGIDMQIPDLKGYKEIVDFETLKNYIESTTNKTITITQNEINAQGVKVVEVIDKDAVKNTFANYQFSLGGKNVSINDAMLNVSSLTGFNVAFRNSATTAGSNIVSNSNNADAGDIKSKTISYRSGNISSFLKYLEVSANVFVDISYEDKMIMVSKYKDLSMPLYVNDRTISKEQSTQTAVSSSSGTSGNSAGVADSGVKTSFSYSIFEQLDKSIAKIVTEANMLSGDKSNFTLNKSTGTVNIVATKDVTEKITAVVNDFNEQFKKSVNVKLTTIELLVKNNINIGTDFSFSKASAKGTTGITTNFTQTIASNLGAILGTTRTSSDGSKNLEASLKSVSEIGYISKVQVQEYETRNLIPTTIKQEQEINYVKNINTTPATVEGVQATQSTETDTLSVGLSAMVLPKIVGEYISLYINPQVRTLNSLEKQKFSNLEVQIPDVSGQSLENEYMLKNGETIIISSYSIFEDADQYSGLVPIKDFIIGGSKDKKIIRKEIIYVISAELR